MTTTVCAEANRQLIARLYAAFGDQDFPAVLQALRDDILWHVPGQGPLSRDYHGHQEVLGLLAQVMERSGRTFRIRVDDLLANDTRVVALVTESGQREGRSWSSYQVHAWTVEDGKASVFWHYQGDQRSDEAFWS
jgi:ketosteroid isomerase-like protein